MDFEREIVHDSSSGQVMFVRIVIGYAVEVDLWIDRLHLQCDK